MSHCVLYSTSPLCTVSTLNFTKLLSVHSISLFCSEQVHEDKMIVTNNNNNIIISLRYFLFICNQKNKFHLITEK